MKSVIWYAVGLLLCVLLLATLPLSGEEKIYDDVVRLHILANSDTEEDQACKLAVRDAILSAYGEVLSCGSEGEAEERVRALMPKIKELSEQTLRARGKEEQVTLVFGDEKYPERTYGDLRFPAGTYHSLRILIGEGIGKNWWCVLFPPLCVGAATGEEFLPAVPEEAPCGMGEGAWRLVSESGKYEIRFRVLEWLYGE